MPHEYTLLSDVEPTTERITTLAATVHPEGAYIEFRGGDIGAGSRRRARGLQQNGDAAARLVGLGKGELKLHRH